MPAVDSRILYSSMPVSGNGDADRITGILQRNLNMGSILLLLSGIAGTIYLIYARHAAYGILAFFQGPVVLGSQIPGAFAFYVVASLLLATFVLSGFSFYFYTRMFSARFTGFPYLRQYRALLSLMVLAYSEVVLVFAVTLAFGANSFSGDTLSFGSGGLLENIFYVLALIFFASFGVSMVAGSIMGNFGLVYYANRLTKRYELIIMYFALFISVYYFPAAILAGLIGIFVANNEKPAFAATYRRVRDTSLGLLYRFQSSRGAQRIVLATGIVTILILYTLSAIPAPVYHNGNVIYYVSAYMSGIYGNLITLGLIISALFFSGSLIALLRRNLRTLGIFMWGIFWGLLILEPTVSLYFLHYGSFAEQSLATVITGSLILLDIGIFPVYIAFLLMESKHRSIKAA